jgi:hypothetical protein
MYRFQRKESMRAANCLVRLPKGAADLAEAEGLAKRDIARADGQSYARELEGRGEACRISQVGEAEAE